MSIESDTTLPAGAPLYKKVKLELVQALQRGDWRPGDAIPSEKRLSEIFNISIGTLRKAVDELTEEKLLIRHQGRGTFVAIQNMRDFTRAFKRLHPSKPENVDDLEELHNVSVTELQKIQAKQEEAKDLGLNLGAEVYRIRLKHLLENTPVALEQVIIPAHRFPNLDTDLVQRFGGNLYQLYQESYATTVLKVQDMVGSEPLNQGLANLLNCEEKQPIVHVKRVAWSYQNDPVECRHSWINPSKAKYVVTTTD
jgi:GntR family transcriptional regulator